jgi:hypothetical protein
MKTEEQLQDYTRIFLPAHENAEDYTDKYGVCHTVVEKEKFYKCTRRTKTLWSITVFENEFKSQTTW